MIKFYCTVCGDRFETDKPENRTCSDICEAALRETMLYGVKQKREDGKDFTPSEREEVEEKIEGLKDDTSTVKRILRRGRAQE